MVPVPRIFSTARSTRCVHLFYITLSSISRYVVQQVSGAPRADADGDHKPIIGALSHSLKSGDNHILQRRTHELKPGGTKFIVFVVLIPILVLLSGVFAGLTLGYMSLDETQLNVLSVSGTPDQQRYASRIKPIRKNGHLLLVTLLLANMIVNETLPIIADPVLGGGAQSVVVSTVLIVIFSEIIPQSLFTRHGLYLGAKMAGLTTFLIYALGIISWPVAKFLEFALGPHHGIMYRRAELKELIALHSSHATLGGDLKRDTVTIIGATLDLQEKVVMQAMTPIDDVFMLSIDSKLDCSLLQKICETGHSRVPVYEEVQVSRSGSRLNADVSSCHGDEIESPSTHTVKKIVGILLVKHCVMLDPKDATPIRNMALNKVHFVPSNKSLLGMLDEFQEGRSHMAVVSHSRVAKAESVKKIVKHGLTQRLRQRLTKTAQSRSFDLEQTGRDFPGGHNKLPETCELQTAHKQFSTPGRSKRQTMITNVGDTEKAEMSDTTMVAKMMPANTVGEGDTSHKDFDPAMTPLGIITLEDVLEELIGEEIYDEFDAEGAHGDPYHIDAQGPPALMAQRDAADVPLLEKLTPRISRGLRKLSFLRSRSAPPTQRLNGRASNLGQHFKDPESPTTPKKVDSAQETRTPEPHFVPEMSSMPPDSQMQISYQRTTFSSSAPTTRVPSPVGQMSVGDPRFAQA